jgi:monovalent cation:H+ antiporter-2, CPA2 family
MATGFEIGAYKDALIVLGTAGLLVPLVARFKISPVLGFLLAGAVLGPKGLGALKEYSPALRWITVSDQEDVAQIAEFGVVFLLFLIALELSLPRLITMRRLIFGLGSLQVGLSALIIGVFAGLRGLATAPALIIAIALALSSTAIVIEVLARRHRLSSGTGRTSFAVLLFQDLAVVPFIFLVSILGVEKDGSIALGLFRALGQSVIAIAAIVLIGRRVLRPFFRLVASSRSHELFVAATLFVVVTAGLVSASTGMSMALGAFIAGLLLAETEYRRAIEATIEPFKGLLLGIFFFSVGMSIDVRSLLNNPFLLVAAAFGLIATKALVVTVLARAFQLSWPTAIETGLLLGPGGEFAFVIIGLGMTYGIVGADTAAFTLAVVSLTMLVIPACASLGRSLANRIRNIHSFDPEFNIIPPEDHKIRALIIGYGRVGELVSVMLERHGVPYLATDRDPALVAKWRRRSRPVYYGDARQELFLQRCGIQQASAVIITIRAQAEIDEIVRVVRTLRQDVVIVSRARDARHASHLYELGVSDAVPETIEASLQLSEAALIGLGAAVGPVIASIHEKRDEFRRLLQGAASKAGQTSRALRSRQQG